MNSRSAIVLFSKLIYANLNLIFEFVSVQPVKWIDHKGKEFDYENMKFKRTEYIEIKRLEYNKQ